VAEERPPLRRHEERTAKAGNSHELFRATDPLGFEITLHLDTWSAIPKWPSCLIW